MSAMPLLDIATDSTKCYTLYAKQSIGGNMAASLKFKFNTGSYDLIDAATGEVVAARVDVDEAEKIAFRVVVGRPALSADHGDRVVWFHGKLDRDYQKIVHGFSGKGQ